MATQSQYRVGSKAGVVLGSQSTYFGPNTLIPASMLTDAVRARMLRERLIVMVGAPVQAPVKEPTPPGIGIGDATFSEIKSHEGGAEIPTQTANPTAAAREALTKIQQARESGEVAPRTPVTEVAIVKQTEPVSGAVWTHDPDGLIGQPVETLRQLVRDIDPTMEVDHLDEVELIAILSSEYTAPVEAKS